MRDLLLLIAGAGLTFIGTRMTAAYSRRDTETVRLRQAMIAVEQATKFSDVIELSAYPSSPEDFAFRRERLLACFESVHERLSDVAAHHPDASVRDEAWTHTTTARALRNISERILQATANGRTHTAGYRDDIDRRDRHVATLRKYVQAVKARSDQTASVRLRSWTLVTREKAFRRR